jgi:pimeloyl-ACP methyl ester carboxylesterase
MLGAGATAVGHRYAARVAVTTLTTVDGVRLAAHLHHVARPRGTVVLAHGFTASATHDDVEALAGALVDAEYDVVTYDARGHGGSTGQCTLGDLERHDVAAAARAARPASGQVVLVGLSMGAIAVLRHAASTERSVGDPAVAGVVTVSAPARWKLPRNARGVLSAGITSTAPGRAFAARQLGVRLAARRHRPAPPVDLVSALDVPVAIVHGIDDPFLPSSNARVLFDAAHDPRRLDLVPGAWHAHDEAALPVVAAAVGWTLDPVSGRD